VVVTEGKEVEGLFERLPASVVALEVGGQSPWVSRLLEKLGHQAIVANARRVKLISQSSGKNDRLDAEFLARLARTKIFRRNENAISVYTLENLGIQNGEVGQCIHAYAFSHWWLWR
jgi:transposase